MAHVLGPEGPLEVLVTGSGSPVTLFAHGLAGSIAETRPFGSGVHGTRVFFHFRSHGSSAAPETPWTYAVLEAELLSVRAAHDARRGLGVSLGAGALLRAATHQPDLFDRLVVILPAAIDEPRIGRAVERVEQMATYADKFDAVGLAAELLAEQPEQVRGRRIVQVWARQQAEQLLEPTIRRMMRTIPLMSPLEDRLALAAIKCPVLVIGHEGDEAHPSRLVHELVEALPDAQGKVFGSGGVLWTHRAALRPLITDFLND
ncbi:MAG: alpha/beta hydrolase [Nocardioidaceae bacterium]|nr:alpha/beta hydrolase [Nocardioidaceae bacterium]